MITSIKFSSFDLIEKFYPDYQGSQSTKDKYIKAKDAVLKFTYTVLSKLNKMVAEVKILGVKLKYQIN